MSRYHTDSATDQDLLRYQDFQEALYDVITQAETPLTVGVFGTWGSGKSSLMQMLRRRLEDERLPSRRTVWFTAWKYDRQDALWRAFILRVLDALYPRETKPEGAPREERPVLANPNEQEQRLIALLQRLEESVYQVVEWSEIGERAINWWQFIGNTTKAGVETAAALGTAGLFPQIKKLVGGDDTPASEIQKAAAAISRETREYHRHQLFHMEQFEATFKEAVQLLDKEGKGRLIVFVDDLDRCLPEKAVEVLEAIKLFLEAPGVVFVLGMDQAVIRQGIEARYSALLRQSGAERPELPIRGDSYLQKIVQIPFHLPPLAVDDVADYITQLAADLSPRTQQTLAQGLYPNPRQVKRVLNILRLLRGVADRRFPKDMIADPLLAKTVVIQTQYPELYQLWRQYPTLVQTLETEYARRAGSEEEILMGRRRAPAAEGAEQPGETASGTAGSVERRGLLADYLENRMENTLLRRMMTFPPEDETGAGRERARFAGLTRKQVQVYVRLAGTVESDGAVPTAAVPLSLEAFLGGEAVQIQEAASLLDGEEADRQGPRHRQARQQLVEILQNPNQPLAARLSAGESLAVLGDPRLEVVPQTVDGLAQMPFCFVPKGSFWLGSDEEENEQPAAELDLPYDYWLARYPVTVAQYRLFVEATGQKPGDADSLRDAPNRPVRWLTWHEALAFCGWLDGLWRDKLPAGCRVTLPSEVEWEKAARGGLLIPGAAHMRAILDADFRPAPGALRLVENPLPQRRYPWGDEFDANKANTEESGIGDTSAVGAFPGGETPYGCLEMSGNVWEWTRSHWQAYPYQLDGKREDLQAGDEVWRVFRGSVFAGNNSYARCSFRLGLFPHFRSFSFGVRLAVSPFTFDR